MWEYLAAHYSVNRDLTSINQVLNSYGKDGWELVSIIDDDANIKIFFFKRVLIEKAKK